MIFHHPFPIKEEFSGSQVHLVHMAEAFRDAGYEVELVTGYTNQRKRAVKRIKQIASEGRKLDFVYSEASTMPSIMAKRNFSSPFLDFRFFKWCKNQSIPVGLFYGDVHWRFDQFRTVAPWYRRAVAIPLYWYDWMNYLRLVDHLFIPSLAMRRVLPSQWSEDRVSALFPGCDICDLSEKSTGPQNYDRLELLYVGGVMPPLYDLKPMFDAVQASDTIILTICCRASEWEKVQSYYAPADSRKIRIIHAHGKGLKTYYAMADLFGLFWRPNPYLDFAMPVKVFEALGYGLPIVTTAGTEVARFIAQERIGWVVSATDELHNLLIHLQANPQIIAEKRRHVKAVRERHTWQVRAQMVAELLTRREHEV